MRTSESNPGPAEHQSNPMAEIGVPALPELWQLGAVLTAVGSCPKYSPHRGKQHPCTFPISFQEPHSIFPPKL